MAIRPERIGEYEAEHKAKQWENLARSAGQLMIASQRINQPGESGPYQDKTTYPKETEGQKLEKSGQYLKDPETEVDTSQPLESRMFDIDPKKHRDKRKTERIHKKATDPQAQGSEKDWVKKTGPQLPKLNIKPADLLKILQFLPALTGFGSPAMAHVNEDGTAHDWRAPGHGGLRVPGGEVNPHGRRGTNTWDDGRQKYSEEELKQIEDYMKSLQISQVNYGPPTERDLFLQRFQGPGGTLRNHPAKIRPTILSIAERMKA